MNKVKRFSPKLIQTNPAWFHFCWDFSARSICVPKDVFYGMIESGFQARSTVPGKDLIF